MPSVKNPNGPSKNRVAARAATARKANKKRSAGAVNKENRVAKADEKRGARLGLLPTSGPNRALSSKKKRKLERKLGHALKRKMEADGEVEMKDAPEYEKTKTGEEQDMAVDTEDIS
ncbi:hypothetical protein F4804DRAFT_131803 [Jackrogersella minutella]|nr:hypothetical protein F4804DRAFT_131803 [Jackrogersella minutella]